MEIPKHNRKLAVLIMPYFGQWPEWIDIYFETCRWNREVDYLFFTDCSRPENPLPSNVSLITMSFGEFNDLYIARFPRRRRIQNTYKICDLRPAYGALFSEYLQNYDFFGWGDIDVIYGRISSYLTAEMLAADLISFNRRHMSGHLTLARTSCANSLVESFPNWLQQVDDPEYQHLDEPKVIEGLKVSAEESFNTPLSPITPWTDGRFVFPTEWYWRAGELTNDLDRGRTFPYLHFMHWKGGEWPRKCGNGQWEALDSVMHLKKSDIAFGFRINSGGFFPLRG
jgi:hypothetical protein